MTKELVYIASKQYTELDSVSAMLGRKVYGSSGTYAGKVQDILLNNNRAVAMLIKRGFTKCIISTEFISAESTKTLMLTIDPVILHIGKVVYDKEGRKLGKVVDIIKKGENSIKEIIVRQNIFRKQLVIPGSEIAVSKANIILKRAYEP